MIAAGMERLARESRKSGDVVRDWVFDDKRSDEEREADRAREERMQAGIAAWAGWDELKS